MFISAGNSFRRCVGLMLAVTTLVAASAAFASSSSAQKGAPASFAPYVDMTLHGKAKNTSNIRQSSGNYTDITTWGTFHDSNNNSEHGELVGGRTAITTEAMEAYNNLRAFLGLPALTIEDVGEWAFSNELTNNTQAWGDDVKGVGLYYAMQGAKVGWITDENYDPQILADIQRTARLGDKADVMDMIHEFGIKGFADYLERNGIKDTFINTLKMEPHYGGWMHGRTHGWRSIEGVAIAHDVNHLTVLSWDQMQPFMNDTFDWPQWPALDVSDSGVIEYFQSMVVLGNPVGNNDVSSPDSTGKAPYLDISKTKRSQKVKRLRLKLTANQASRLQIGGGAKVPRQKHASTRAKTKNFKLQPRTGIQLQAGFRKTIQLRLKKHSRTLRRIKRLREGSERARSNSKVLINLTAVSVLGVATTQKVKIKLKG